MLDIVIFIMKGKVGVGYEINKMKKLYMVYRDKCVIGAFETTFH